jgi:predicted TIM-barrel enzyme
MTVSLLCAIAEATKSHFVRINVLNNTMYTDQGIIEGDAHTE